MATRRSRWSSSSRAKAALFARTYGGTQVPVSRELLSDWQLMGQLMNGFVSRPIARDVVHDSVIYTLPPGYLVLGGDFTKTSMSVHERKLLYKKRRDKRRQEARSSSRV